MATVTDSFAIPNNATLNRSYVALQSDGVTPQPLDGWLLVSHWRYADGSLALELSTDNGLIVITNAAAGAWKFLVSPWRLLNVEPGSINFDVLGVPPGAAPEIAMEVTGVITVVPGYTVGTYSVGGICTTSGGGYALTATGIGTTLVDAAAVAAASAAALAASQAAANAESDAAAALKEAEAALAAATSISLTGLPPEIVLDANGLDATETIDTGSGSGGSGSGSGSGSTNTVALTDSFGQPVGHIAP